MALHGHKLDWPALIAAIVVCLLAGAIGSIFTFSAIPTWYAALAKPSFSPPNWVFGPVWTALYILMGVSAYLAWKQGKKADFALKIFGVQLFLNALWSFLFFGMRSPALGFAGIVPLWLSIAYCIRLFWPLDRKAAYLLLPYMAWVSFATLLNLAIWMLNG
ncbi:MAG: tryptophan-rich sensory protein [Candidatus Micrarchaeota archaeon]|nr:tryptophan-rich sensory protein [Candidatus Micrarchaeota archaeon]